MAFIDEAKKYVEGTIDALPKFADGKVGKSSFTVGDIDDFSEFKTALAERDGLAVLTKHGDKFQSGSLQKAYVDLTRDVERLKMYQERKGMMRSGQSTRSVDAEIRTLERSIKSQSTAMSKEFDGFLKVNDSVVDALHTHFQELNEELRTTHEAAVATERAKPAPDEALIKKMEKNFDRMNGELAAAETELRKMHMEFPKEVEGVLAEAHKLTAEVGVVGKDAAKVMGKEGAAGAKAAEGGIKAFATNRPILTGLLAAGGLYALGKMTGIIGSSEPSKARG